MPYSVSIPITFWIAMRPPDLRPLEGMKTDGGGEAPRSPPPSFLQVLAGIDDALDRALLVLGLAHERLHIDDALALFAGDLGPVVGVGGIGEIFVFLELFADGGE